jgi:hypothetical protein
VVGESRQGKRKRERELLKTAEQSLRLVTTKDPCLPSFLLFLFLFFFSLRIRNPDTTRWTKAGNSRKVEGRAESGGIPDIGALPAGRVMIIIMITSKSVEIRGPRANQRCCFATAEPKRLGFHYVKIWWVPYGTADIGDGVS